MFMWDRGGEVKLASSSAAGVIVTIGAKYAFADNVGVLLMRLLYDSSMGYPLVVFLAMLAGILW